MSVSTHDGFQVIATGAPICNEPGAIPWNYARSETIADLTIHIIGLCLGFAAATVLLALAAQHAPIADIIAASIYSLGLLAMLTFSAAYNLWPVCPTKWRLRRCDQSAIYVLIAATYTPFLTDTGTGVAALALLIGVWCVATLGIALTLAFPGRLDRLSIVIYVVMGWSVVLLRIVKDVPIRPTAFQLLVAGGMLLSFGLIFHLWEKLKFQNAIWHVFVLLGVTCQYAAVMKVVLS